MTEVRILYSFDSSVCIGLYINSCVYSPCNVIKTLHKVKFTRPVVWLDLSIRPMTPRVFCLPEHSGIWIWGTKFVYKLEQKNRLFVSKKVQKFWHEQNFLKMLRLVEVPVS